MDATRIRRQTVRMTSRDWRFAGRPVWLAGHLVALTAIVAFVAAGLWQVDRHGQRQSLNDEIDARLAAPVVALDEVVSLPPGDIRFREVTATGRLDTSEEVILVLQSLDGVSGHRVLTPLLTPEGKFDAVLVDRGWVPLALDQPRQDAFAGPAGDVTVTGFVLTTQTRGRSIPDVENLTQIGRVDIERLQQQVPYDLAPVFLHLSERLDDSAELPRLSPLPSLDPGRPHLSYAVQWFLFAAVVVVGYVVLMLRTSRRDDGDAEASAPL